LDEKPLNIDNKLTIQLKKGNIKAFEEIFNRYKSQLYFFALGYLKSTSEAEEVVQDTFLSLWEHRESLIDSLSLKSYLYRITTNTIYNHLKHMAVRRKYAEFAILNMSEEDDDTQKRLDLKDLENRLENITEKLPDQTRKVFKMSREEGLSHDEIAKQLGISVRTVENLIYRALKFIKENLKDERLLILLLISIVR